MEAGRTRILFIADVHANLPALVALPLATQTFCAGDLIGYGPHPREVLAIARASRMICVRGDEDDAVCSGAAHVAPPGLEAACEETRSWTKDIISDQDQAYLRELPPEAERIVDGARIAVIHAYPGDFERYIAPTEEQLDRIARAFPRATVIVIGHTHRPGIWSVRDKLIVNPGSVGQPMHPGLASYAVLEDGMVRLREVPFDLDVVRNDLRAVPITSHARAQALRALDEGAERPRDRVPRDPLGEPKHRVRASAEH